MLAVGWGDIAILEEVLERAPTHDYEGLSLALQLALGRRDLPMVEVLIDLAASPRYVELERLFVVDLNRYRLKVCYPYLPYLTLPYLTLPYLTLPYLTLPLPYLALTSIGTASRAAPRTSGQIILPRRSRRRCRRTKMRPSRRPLRPPRRPQSSPPPLRSRRAAKGTLRKLLRRRRRLLVRQRRVAVAKRGESEL